VTGVSKCTSTNFIHRGRNILTELVLAVVFIVLAVILFGAALLVTGRVARRAESSGGPQGVAFKECHDLGATEDERSSKNLKTMCTLVANGWEGTRFFDLPDGGSFQCKRELTCSVRSHIVVCHGSRRDEAFDMRVKS